MKERSVDLSSDKHIHTHDGAPLSGRSICVTRAADQASDFIGVLLSLGAEVMSLPTIEIVDPPDESLIEAALVRIQEYSWIIFTSTNAVERFYAYAARGGLVQIPSEIHCAVVGSATAAALAEQGIAPTLLPRDFKAEGLMEEFEAIACATDISGQRILMPRALAAREVLPQRLRELGYHVDIAPVYETVPATFDPAKIALLLDESTCPDAITFTAPSTARNFCAACEKAGINPLEVFECSTPVSIGAITTAALKELGVDSRIIIESTESTTRALVDTLVAHFGQRN